MKMHAENQNRMWELSDREIGAVSGGLLAGDIAVLVEKAKAWISEKLAWRIRF